MRHATFRECVHRAFGSEVTLTFDRRGADGLQHLARILETHPNVHASIDPAQLTRVYFPGRWEELGGRDILVSGLSGVDDPALDELAFRIESLSHGFLANAACDDGITLKDGVFDQFARWVIDEQPMRALRERYMLDVSYHTSDDAEEYFPIVTFEVERHCIPILTMGVDAWSCRTRLNGAWNHKFLRTRGHVVDMLVAETYRAIQNSTQ